jgi:hypothetical protein
MKEKLARFCPRCSSLDYIRQSFREPSDLYSLLFYNSRGSCCNCGNISKTLLLRVEKNILERLAEV